MKVADHTLHIPPSPIFSPVRAIREEAVATAERRLAEVAAGLARLGAAVAGGGDLPAPEVVDAEPRPRDPED